MKMKMKMKQYGLTKENMQYARRLLALGYRFDCVMVVLQQIYEDSKTFYK